MSHIHHTLLGALTVGALTVGLLGAAGCSSADGTDDGNSSAAAASEAEAKGTSVVLDRAGKSATFKLENLDERHTMMLSVRGPGAMPLGSCPSPYHPPEDETIANIKIEYDGIVKYTQCEITLLFDKAADVRVTSLANWNDVDGNRLTVTLQEAAVGAFVELPSGAGEPGVEGQLCRVGDPCVLEDEPACGEGWTRVPGECNPSLDVWSVSGQFNQNYGFCSESKCTRSR